MSTTRTATDRMIAARAVTQTAIERELLWATVASHIWPSCLMEPGKRQEHFPAILVVDTPAGRLVYRLSSDELASGLFDHLETRPNDGKPADDKIGTLWQLAHGFSLPK